MQPIVIIGGSGFIGKSLLNLYETNDATNIYLLVRNPKSIDVITKPGIKIIQGELTDETSISALIQPEAIVINLAFIKDADKAINFKALEILIKKCKSIGIKRFLHCSTSSVYGASKETIITEETICNPKTNYEITKYELEQYLINESFNSFELVILRPTSIFGQNGKNLIKFINSIEKGNPILNYLRACIYWKRRMNLVSVETVASAIKYLSESNKIKQQEIFIVSEDNDEKNNYFDIEKILRKYLCVNNYIIPILPIPNIILELLLWARRRSNIKSNTIYSNKKLLKQGFVPPKNFIDSLKSYINSL